MSRFGEIRKMAEMAKEAGYSQPFQRRELIEVNRPPQEEDELFNMLYDPDMDLGFMEVLRDPNHSTHLKEKIYQIMETQSGIVAPRRELNQLLGNLFQIRTELTLRQHTAKDSEKFLGRWLKFREPEIRSYNFALQYLEDWFLKGNWAKPTKYEAMGSDRYQYNLVPAVLLNTMAKIQEISAYDSRMKQGFDRVKIYNLLCQKVPEFAEEYFSLHESGKPLPKEYPPLGRKGLNQARNAFRISQLNVEKSLDMEYFDKNSSRPSPYVKIPAELYFAKTAMIAAEKARLNDAEQVNRHYFMADTEILKPGQPYGRYQAEAFQFGGRKGDPLHEKMHYLPVMMPMAKFAVEYFRKKNEQTGKKYRK